MEEAIQSIYDCLQISEEKFLEKRALLRMVKEEKSKEKSKQNLLKAEISRLKKEISMLKSECARASVMEDIQEKSCDMIKHHLDDICMKHKKTEALLDTEAAALDQNIDVFSKEALTFHSRFRLDTGVLTEPLSAKEEELEVLALEEDAFRCDLKVREALLKECQALDEDLKRRREKLLLLETEVKERKELIEKRLQEVSQKRDSLSYPKKVPEIQALETKAIEMEQETEFLKAAVFALQQEVENSKPKDQVTPNRSQFTFRSFVQNNPCKLSTPQVFTRDE